MTMKLFSSFKIALSSCLSCCFQAIEDAKKVIEEERAFAHAEIESARAAMQRVEDALQEQEQMSRSAEKQVGMKSS